MKTVKRLFCLALCLFLTGCASGAQTVQTPLPTERATENTATAFSETPSPTPSSSPTPAAALSPTPALTPTVLPTASPTPHLTLSPTPGATTPPPAPETQPGVNILHEGFGENARFVIALDPGHQRVGMSEKEPNSPATDVMKAKVTYGTQGVATRIPECDLNLAVALYVRDALLEKGYTVVMTHEVADVSLSNRERAQIANDANAAVSVHIHANGSSEPGARGALTICPTQSNPACGDLYGDCRRLAEILLDTYCEETGISKEFVWETDTMTGINWSRVPTATLEMGYMSNPDEDRLMATESFRRTAAKAIAEAIEKYLHG